MPVRDADRDGEVVFVVAVVVVDVEYRKDLDARTYSYSAPHVNVARLMAPPLVSVTLRTERFRWVTLSEKGIGGSQGLVVTGFGGSGSGWLGVTRELEGPEGFGEGLGGASALLRECRGLGFTKSPKPSHDDSKIATKTKNFSF